MGVSESVGDVVRRRREERAWTLDHAATRLGISRRLLTQIEAGTANPSLSTLLSIASGFGIDLVDLVQGAEISTHHRVQADNDTADVLWSTDNGSAARLLVGLGPLEMWSFTLAPGDSRRAAAHSPGSIEALVVARGRVQVAMDTKDAIEVGAGQSLIFTAESAHEYRNVHTSDAMFQLAVYDPISRGSR